MCKRQIKSYNEDKDLHQKRWRSPMMIGDRQGSFPGMLERRTFRIVRVADAHGIGIVPASESNATIEYDGKATSVQVHPRP